MATDPMKLNHMTPQINRCRHHSNPEPLVDSCAVGVDIGALVKRGTFGAFYKLPCHDATHLDIRKVECVKCSFFTPEEVAAKEKQDREWMDKFSQRLTKMAPMIRKIKAMSISQGSFMCPICGQTGGKWSRAPNGHVRMKCSSDDCINFIE